MSTSTVAYSVSSASPPTGIPSVGRGPGVGPSGVACSSALSVPLYEWVGPTLVPHASSHSVPRPLLPSVGSSACSPGSTVIIDGHGVASTTSVAGVSSVPSCECLSKARGVNG